MLAVAMSKVPDSSSNIAGGEKDQTKGRTRCHSLVMVQERYKRTSWAPEDRKKMLSPKMPHRWVLAAVVSQYKPEEITSSYAVATVEGQEAARRKDRNKEEEEVELNRLMRAHYLAFKKHTKR